MKYVRHLKRTRQTAGPRRTAHTPGVPSDIPPMPPEHNPIILPPESPPEQPEQMPPREPPVPQKDPPATPPPLR